MKYIRSRFVLSHKFLLACAFASLGSICHMIVREVSAHLSYNLERDVIFSIL